VTSTRFVFAVTFVLRDVLSIDNLRCEQLLADGIRSSKDANAEHENVLAGPAPALLDDGIDRHLGSSFDRQLISRYLGSYEAGFSCNEILGINNGSNSDSAKQRPSGVTAWGIDEFASFRDCCLGLP
jgi:hypothetical protein